MRKPTHILGATAMVLLAGYATPECLAAAAFGGLLPDIDQPQSALGAKNPLARFLKHRGFCHSLAFALLIYLFSTSVFSQQSSIAIALLIGILSHLLLDMFNRNGICLLWPLNGMVRIPLARIRTGSITEIVLRIALFAANALLLYIVYFKK